MTLKQIHSEDIVNSKYFHEINGQTHADTFPNIPEDSALVAEIRLRGKPNFVSSIVVEDIDDLNETLDFDKLSNVNLKWMIIDKVPASRCKNLDSLYRLFQQ